MPISETKVVREIHDRMRREGKPVMTMTWSDFYELNEADKLRQSRLDKIRDVARDTVNLVVGYGNNVVVFAQDTNFGFIDEA